MALDWDALDLIGNNLVQYFFGTDMALAVGVVVFFLLLLMASGLEFKYSLLFILPLLAAYTVGGAFGVNVWVLHTGIIIAGIIYSSAIIKVMS